MTHVKAIQEMNSVEFTRFCLKQLLMQVDDSNLDETTEFLTNLLVQKGVTV